MVVIAAFSAALFAQPQKDSGRVEVEGLVVTAVARPSRFGGIASGQGEEYEVEFTVEPKGGGARLTFQIEDGVSVLDADGKTVSLAGRFGRGMPPTPSGANRWIVRLTFPTRPADKLHAVEGTVSFAPAQIKSVIFAGATLKPNSTVSIEGGTVKLIVFDFDDGRPDVRVRATVPSPGQQPTSVRGARATLVDANGKETVLASSGINFAGGSKSVDHRLTFRTSQTVDAGSLKMLRVEIPLPSGAFKNAKFRIKDVPVQGADSRRGLEP